MHHHTGAEAPRRGSSLPVSWSGARRDTDESLSNASLSPDRASPAPSASSQAPAQPLALHTSRRRGSAVPLLSVPARLQNSSSWEFFSSSKPHKPRKATPAPAPRRRGAGCSSQSTSPASLPHAPHAACRPADAVCLFAPASPQSSHRASNSKREELPLFRAQACLASVLHSSSGDFSSPTRVLASFSLPRCASCPALRLESSDARSSFFSPSLLRSPSARDMRCPRSLAGSASSLSALLPRQRGSRDRGAEDEEARSFDVAAPPPSCAELQAEGTFPPPSRPRYFPGGSASSANPRVDRFAALPRYGFPRFRSLPNLFSGASLSFELLPAPGARAAQSAPRRPSAVVGRREGDILEEPGTDGERARRRDSLAGRLREKAHQRGRRDSEGEGEGGDSAVEGDEKGQEYEEKSRAAGSTKGHLAPRNGKAGSWSRLTFPSVFSGQRRLTRLRSLRASNRKDSKAARNLFAAFRRLAYAFSAPEHLLPAGRRTMKEADELLTKQDGGDKAAHDSRREATKEQELDSQRGDEGEEDVRETRNVEITPKRNSPRGTQRRGAEAKEEGPHDVQGGEAAAREERREESAGPDVNTRKLQRLERSLSSSVLPQGSTAMTGDPGEREATTDTFFFKCDKGEMGRGSLTQPPPQETPPLSSSLRHAEPLADARPASLAAGQKKEEESDGGDPFCDDDLQRPSRREHAAERQELNGKDPSSSSGEVSSLSSSSESLRSAAPSSSSSLFSCSSSGSLSWLTSKEKRNPPHTPASSSQALASCSLSPVPASPSSARPSSHSSLSPVSAGPWLLSPAVFFAELDTCRARGVDSQVPVCREEAQAQRDVLPCLMDRGNEGKTRVEEADSAPRQRAHLFQVTRQEARGGETRDRGTQVDQTTQASRVNAEAASDLQHHGEREPLACRREAEKTLAGGEESREKLLAAESRTARVSFSSAAPRARRDRVSLSRDRDPGPSTPTQGDAISAVGRRSLPLLGEALGLRQRLQTEDVRRYFPSAPQPRRLSAGAAVGREPQGEAVRPRALVPDSRVEECNAEAVSGGLRRNLGRVEGTGRGRLPGMRGGSCAALEAKTVRPAARGENRHCLGTDAERSGAQTEVTTPPHGGGSLSELLCGEARRRHRHSLALERARVAQQRAKNARRRRTIAALLERVEAGGDGWSSSLFRSTEKTAGTETGGQAAVVSERERQLPTTEKNPARALEAEELEKPRREAEREPGREEGQEASSESDASSSGTSEEEKTDSSSDSDGSTPAAGQQRPAAGTNRPAGRRIADATAPSSSETAGGTDSDSSPTSGTGSNSPSGRASASDTESSPESDVPSASSSSPRARDASETTSSSVAAESEYSSESSSETDGEETSQRVARGELRRAESRARRPATRDESSSGSGNRERDRTIVQDQSSLGREAPAVGGSGYTSSKSEGEEERVRGGDSRAVPPASPTRRSASIGQSNSGATRQRRTQSDTQKARKSILKNDGSAKRRNAGRAPAEARRIDNARGAKTEGRAAPCARPEEGLERKTSAHGNTASRRNSKSVHFAPSPSCAAGATAATEEESRRRKETP
ncbi:hypothetical protein BESB_047500 [Besnoitia besnoiti]|uniref:Uncharacterized protein n=1 Tax=Besnoitia besnoiti TaxID=94643 RepID=A0A2A9MDH9_BESBE|nr:hypothetical protein BESB_047500 [Besnoitia besnoiti]PFH36558.1 hypothetical protein BESB_047500 [Besnoitia besnoiti]